ncbi:hypothetical protein LZ30DRAFT_462997 [Colletotrichum cereale]|nr:hypothetical protein LZ30DRAFT_462997 [Colletotrichum cereale]
MTSGSVGGGSTGPSTCVPSGWVLWMSNLQPAPWCPATAAATTAAITTTVQRCRQHHDISRRRLATSPTRPSSSRPDGDSVAEQEREDPDMSSSALLLPSSPVSTPPRSKGRFYISGRAGTTLDREPLNEAVECRAAVARWSAESLSMLRPSSSSSSSLSSASLQAPV